ncbi:MAG TPA: hypothetical protein VNQ48_06445 [Microbacteriaceae bacterium]|nr:hypothetical protein [Microbacteriaceae bacterium]
MECGRCGAPLGTAASYCEMCGAPIPGRRAHGTRLGLSGTDATVITAAAMTGLAIVLGIVMLVRAALF